jgi:hypothetical protein
MKRLFLAVLIGGLCVYLGYRLFLEVKTKTDSEGKFVLPMGISIYLSRVGPGVFFALFGAFIVAYSIASPLTVKDGDYNLSPSPTNYGEISYMTGKSIEGDTEGLSTNRQQIIADLKTIGRLESVLREYHESGKVDLSKGLVSDNLLTLPRVKRLMMFSVWDEKQWGDRGIFVQWIDKGMPKEIPDEIMKATEYYNPY